jgi:phosphonate transport system permease protein
VTIAGTTPDIVVPRHPLLRRLTGYALWAGLFALLAWAWAGAEMYRAGDLIRDWRNMAEFGRAFLQPNFHDWDSYLADTVVTVQIAIWGTTLAVVGGIPFAILASANIAPQWVVQPVRRLMDACRAINEIVFALMFVVAVGLGPFAGVMALAVHNLGVFAKLFSEAVEAIDPRPIEGIRATGARRSQEVIFGVIPRCCRCGARLPSIAWRPMCARRPRSASSAPAASGRRFMRASAASITARPRPR